ncbi:hypothetical protein BMS3Abin07_00070 [bacterium BMS3Abin07]|nr:hypothetical protein BMS3Abin07_00070 [bacterium BMS3Abin07]
MVSFKFQRILRSVGHRFHQINIRSRKYLPFFSRYQTPISDNFGFDRGKPIGRYYIEKFLDNYKGDIQGNVLEVQESVYTHKFGQDRVIRSDVLDIMVENPNATIYGNLETGEGIPINFFDCIIITHVYQYIYDVKAAITNSYNALKPGGILLAVLPGLLQIARSKQISIYVDNEYIDRFKDYWRFTDASASYLFGEIFQYENVIVETYGNVLSASAYLYGLAAHELKKNELDYHDPDYQVLIVIRAVKPINSIE